MTGGGATLKPRGQHHDFRDLAFLGDKFKLNACSISLDPPATPVTVATF